MGRWAWFAGPYILALSFSSRLLGQIALPTQRLNAGVSQLEPTVDTISPRHRAELWRTYLDLQWGTPKGPNSFLRGLGTNPPTPAELGPRGPTPTTHSNNRVREARLIRYTEQTQHFLGDNLLFTSPNPAWHTASGAPVNAARIQGQAGHVKVPVLEADLRRSDGEGDDFKALPKDDHPRGGWVHVPTTMFDNLSSQPSLGSPGATYYGRRRPYYRQRAVVHPCSSRFAGALNPSRPRRRLESGDGAHHPAGLQQESECQDLRLEKYGISIPVHVKRK